MLQGAEVSGFRAHSRCRTQNPEDNGQVVLSSQRALAESQVKNSHGILQMRVL